MTERKIKPVEDNYDKRKTYANHKSRYEVAMKYGFYMEAIMIDYSIIEDRLRSLLYHMGFLANRNATGILKKSRPYLSKIIRAHKSESENDSLGIKNVSSKMKIIRCVLLWTHSAEGGADNRHLSALRTQCEGLDIQEFLNKLGEIKVWCDYRNEIVHALMNKNLESLNSELEEKAKKGMRLANYLDSKTRTVKLKNKIRKAANLSMN